MSVPPEVVAIVNITEDSFSDGGRYLSAENAIRHSESLIAQGADWIELGPASSNPDAALVPAEDQIARLRPVLDAVASKTASLSVDATHTDVLRFALECESVAMVNDIRGFGDASLYPDLAASRAKLVVVHSLLEQERATRDEATPSDVLASIDRFFDQRLAALVRAGVSEDRLIVDPGMGFFLGRDPAASVAVLQSIPDLQARFGRPIFISVSRKSFLRALSGRDVKQIEAATLTAELFATERGAAYLRTHEPARLRDGLTVRAALRKRVPLKHP